VFRNGASERLRSTASCATWSSPCGIHRWRWPGDQRDGNGVLHAKLLVVDGHRALVGSANLTSKALAHNLEVGAVIDDPDLAWALEDHLRQLMATGVLQPSE